MAASVCSQWLKWKCGDGAVIVGLFGGCGLTVSPVLGPGAEPTELTFILIIYCSGPYFYNDSMHMFVMLHYCKHWPNFMTTPTCKRGSIPQKTMLRRMHFPFVNLTSWAVTDLVDILARIYCRRLVCSWLAATKAHGFKIPLRQNPIYWWYRTRATRVRGDWRQPTFKTVSLGILSRGVCLWPGSGRRH